MTPLSGLMVGAFNMLGNTINSLLFVCAETSASANGEHFPQTPLIVGSVLYTLGLGIEWVSEQQRHAIKRDRGNTGRVYMGGLFALSRHVNYFGYVLWRTGYALAAGGWVWAGVNAVLMGWNFVRNVIPVHQRYLEDRVSSGFSEAFGGGLC